MHVIVRLYYYSALRSLSCIAGYPASSIGNNIYQALSLDGNRQSSILRNAADTDYVFDALFIENIPINLCLFPQQQLPL